MPIKRVPAESRLIIPRASVERRRSADFLDGALPSWLTAVSGTPSFGGAEDDHRITMTAATNGSTAQLGSNISFFPVRHIAARIDLHGLVFSNANVDIDIAIRNNWVGGLIRQTYTDDLVSSDFLTGSAHNFEQHPYNIRADGEATRERNISLLLMFQTLEMYVLENGAKMLYRQDPVMARGLEVTPYILMTNRDSAPVNFKIRRMDVTLYD